MRLARILSDPAFLESDGDWERLAITEDLPSGPASTQLYAHIVALLSAISASKYCLLYRPVLLFCENANYRFAMMPT